MTPHCGRAHVSTVPFGQCAADCRGYFSTIVPAPTAAAPKSATLKIAVPADRRGGLRTRAHMRTPLFLAIPAAFLLALPGCRRADDDAGPTAAGRLAPAPAVESRPAQQVR